MQEWLEDRPQPAGFCDGCGAPVTEADRFCTSCGRPTRDLCVWCHATLAAGARFCTSCGRPAVHERGRIYLRQAIAGKRIAGFGIRAGIYLLDNLLVTLPVEIALRWVPALQRLDERGARFSDYVDLYGLNAEAWGIIAPLVWLYAALFVAGVSMQWTWNSIGWSPAMRAIGLRIVDAAGNPPGWRRGLGRSAASWLSGLPLGLGYFAAGWHPEKRTWHDRMAGTWVVDVREQR